MTARRVIADLPLGNAGTEERRQGSSLATIAFQRFLNPAIKLTHFVWPLTYELPCGAMATWRMWNMLN